MLYQEYQLAPTKAFINLDNLSYNYRIIKERIGDCKIMAVVKADCYGHGTFPVTKRLVEEGVEFMAVARVAEALELIQNDIDAKILIFGRIFHNELETAIEEDIRLTLTCEKDIDIIARKAKKLNKTAYIHINVDTGMGRTGLFLEDADKIIQKAIDTPNIEVEGLYSHFATADCKDKSYTKIQLNRFLDLLDKLEKRNIEIPYIHMANGSAVLDIPESYRGKFNMARIGLLLYGYYSSVETSESLPLKQVMTLKSKIREIRELPPNSPVSYGKKYITSKKTKIAILPIGYADGILRSFSNKVKVMINGRLYPIVGGVTMSQLMVEVDEYVKEGDEVMFWGESEAGELRASRVAEQAGTIAYELTCSVSRRVPKIFDPRDRTIDVEMEK
ncbi:MAG: alanine racemase [Candidatus Marinimicrobia bacterium]|nr:alanine racemase [Candidatus Neomarinimicrobiota bacterium]